MIVIDLTYGELTIGATIASARRIANAIAGRQQYVEPGRRELGMWEDDYFSCFAEIAVAKYLNLYWSGTLGKMRTLDVGGLVEVKSTPRGRKLLLPKKTKPLLGGTPFVLVYSTPPTMELMGWRYGRDCMVDKYWGDPTGKRPAWFVPVSDLRDMAELKDLIEHGLISPPSPEAPES